MNTYRYEIWGRNTKLATGKVQAESEDEAYEEAGIAAAENGLTNSIHEIILDKEVDDTEN
jgi:hypothetical protein